MPPGWQIAPDKRDGRIKRVHVDMNDFASGHLANHLIPGFRPVRAFAYLPGLCFPRERDTTKNAGTLGFVTQNTGVIYRADGVSIGIEAACRIGLDLGNQTRRLSSPCGEVAN